MHNCIKTYNKKFIFNWYHPLNVSNIKYDIQYAREIDQRFVDENDERSL